MNVDTFLYKGFHISKSQGKMNVDAFLYRDEECRRGRMVNPAVPNQGDKVTCWYTGFTLQTFV